MSNYRNMVYGILLVLIGAGVGWYIWGTDVFAPVINFDFVLCFSIGATAVTFGFRLLILGLQNKPIPSWARFGAIMFLVTCFTCASLWVIVDSIGELVSRESPGGRGKIESFRDLLLGIAGFIILLRLLRSTWKEWKK